MILVDTSVWIDHLHRSEPALQQALVADQVAVHPFVIAELALGSIASREATLALLGRLWSPPTLSQGELLAFVEHAQLWGRGLSPVDAHLLGSSRLTAGGTLWTRDKRLKAAAQDLSIPVLDEATSA